MANNKQTEQSKAQAPVVKTPYPEVKAPESTEPVVQEPAAPVVKDPEVPAQDPVVKELDLLRNTPTDAELRAKAEAEKESNKAALKKAPLVKARTASGGEMWDPENAKVIGAELTLAYESTWLKRNASVGKIIIEE